MAFTADQLLSFADCQTLIETEDFYVNNTFEPTTELVTKVQMLDALWLLGNPPLSTYTDSQHVRYGDITALGTAWKGIDGECVDDAADSVPTAPTLTLTSKTSTVCIVDWSASPGTDDNGVVAYHISHSVAPHTVWSEVYTTNTSATFTPLTPSAVYKFRVRSIDTISQESSWSTYLTVTMDASSGQEDLTTYITDGNNGYTEYAWITGDVGTVVSWSIVVTAESNKWVVYEEPYEYQVSDKWSDTTEGSPTFTITSSITMTESPQLVIRGESIKYNYVWGSIDSTFKINSATDYTVMPSDKTYNIN